MTRQEGNLLVDESRRVLTFLREKRKKLDKVIRIFETMEIEEIPEVARKNPLPSGDLISNATNSHISSKQHSCCVIEFAQHKQPRSSSPQPMRQVSK